MKSTKWEGNNMLVLTRKKNESIIINNEIEITVVDVQNDQIRIGISAPKNVSIYRKEIFLQMKEENKKAAVNNNVSLEDLKKNLKI